MAVNDKFYNCDAGEDASPTAKDPRTFQSSPAWFTETIEIHVGPSKRKYWISKEVASHSSGFFEAMFRTGLAATGAPVWKELTSGVVELPEDDPLVFEIFLQFIRHGRIQIFPNHKRSPNDDDLSQFKSLVEAWILADKLQIVDLKDALVDSVVHSCTINETDDDYYQVWSSKKIQMVYDNTPVECKLRQVFVDYWTARSHEHWIDEEFYALPNEFVWDLCKSLICNREQPSYGPDDWKKLCSYHEHKYGPENCYITKFSNS